MAIVESSSDAHSTALLIASGDMLDRSDRAVANFFALQDWLEEELEVDEELDEELEDELEEDELPVQPSLLSM